MTPIGSAHQPLAVRLTEHRVEAGSFLFIVNEARKNMVERRSELKRRRTRRKKLLKLKAKLAHAKEGRDRDTILNKIHVVSPWWKEQK
jgi:hypothetical protein